MNLIRRDGHKTVDLLFDPAVLPSDLMSFRSEYEAVTQRMLFDILYDSGLYQEAVAVFGKMIRVSPKQTLTVRHVRRYLKMRLALL